MAAGVILGRLAICVACLYFGIQARDPFVRAERLRADNDRVERQVHELELKSQKTELESEEFKSPRGSEILLRKDQYVMPGEKRLKIPGSP